jgi:hypothetical protein
MLVLRNSQGLVLGLSDSNLSDGMELGLSDGNLSDQGLLDSELLNGRADSHQLLSDDGLSHVLGALSFSMGDNLVNILNDGLDLLGDLSVGLDHFSNLLDDGLDDFVLHSGWLVLRLGLLN